MHFQTLLPAQKIGAHHQAAVDSGASFDTTATVRRLILDPWMVTVIASASVFLAVPGLQWLTSNTRSFVTDYFSTMVLIFLAIGAVLSGVKNLESERERYFWRLLGLSLSSHTQIRLSQSWDQNHHVPFANNHLAPMLLQDLKCSRPSSNKKPRRIRRKHWL